MDISHTPALERIARALAGMRLSVNGGGDESSAGAQVDAVWRKHLLEAAAVLHVLREPDPKMAAVGDAQVWTRMVRAALGEEAPPFAPETRTWADDSQSYQKPLG